MAAQDHSQFPKLVPAVANELLDRSAKVVWSLQQEELNGWSKQRMLALLVASISGARLPSWADAERPGQRMHEFITRYRHRHKKAVAAERAVLRRASAAGREVPQGIDATRVELEQALYNCLYGCTPTIFLYGALHLVFVRV